MRQRAYRRRRRAELPAYDANQVSFGQGAIFGTGAYVTAMALSMHGLSWIAAVSLATLGGAIAGLIYAIPALRVQGYYLGFVTLSVAMVFPELLFSLDRYTNGINGISVPAGAWKQPLFFGITPLSLAATGLACLAVAGHLVIRRSAVGRKVRIAGVSPESAQTLGIRPGVVRSAVFCAVAALTGLAGALYPPIVGFVSPAAFHLELSILIFLVVIVGGRGQIFGPLAGVYLLHLLPNVLLVQFVDYRLLAYGVVALLVMLLMPDGLIGSLERRFRGAAAGKDIQLAPDDLPLPTVSGGGGERQPAISIRGASKSFGAVRALDNVDLDIPAGRIVGLVGANGSGKTSLINAITGFSRLSAGSIAVRGEPIAGRSPASVARMGVGRTFQTPRIFNSLTAWENIGIGAEAARHRPGGSGAADERLSGLRERLDHIGTERIPHGQRRSIEVLRVILTGADIILLDEPAAGLSREERGQLEVLLRRLRNESGRTILLVEHDLALVWRVADAVAVMEGGRIVAMGTPQEVASNPEARKLFIEPVHA
nr:ATP-binding cassette domain-containing protein [Rhodoligotrophos defluvii]